MKFYNKMKLLYLERDGSRAGFGAALLETRVGKKLCQRWGTENNILRPITFMSKSLLAAEGCSHIEGEGLAILHGLEEYHYYCFTRDVSIMTDHKAMVGLFKKGVATLSQIMAHPYQNLPIHSKYNIQTWTRSVHNRLAVMTKPHLFLADWLS